jgi:N-succinyldiaminopimelate aminotransferase
MFVLRETPTGAVMPWSDWEKLFRRSERYGFRDRQRRVLQRNLLPDEPPLGSLEAATRYGLRDFKNLVVFTSLSKRSNVPGMRSGFVAGDARLLKSFLLYRTYHGVR